MKQPLKGAYIWATRPGGVRQVATKKKMNDFHIWKHWINEHRGKETDFQIFFDSPLDRQVFEAVRIERTGAQRILNSKAVYSRSRLPRIVTEDIQEETIGDSGRTIEETSGGGRTMQGEATD